MNSKIIFSLFFIHFLASISIVKCEFFSAVSQLKQLSKLELSMLDRIDRLIDETSQNLIEYKNGLKYHKDVVQMDTETELEESFNPIEGFHRFKRLAKHRELAEWLEHNQPSKETLAFPGKQELEGATEALVRLQATYLLPLEDLANGIITSKNIHNPYQAPGRVFRSKGLSANDCYLIAKHANDSMKYYQETILWAEQALRLIENDVIDFDEMNSNADTAKENKESKNILKYNVLRLLSDALRRLEFNAEAVLFLNEALQLVPETLERKILLEKYQTELQNKKSKLRSKNFGYENIKPQLVPHWDDWSSMFSYEALCRGEPYLPEANYSKLYCFNLDTSNIDSYYKLWKIKVEEAGKTPHIVQFHDVIFDEEIEFLKNYASGLLQRAMVEESNGSEYSRERTSQSAWGHDEFHPLFMKLSRRIQALTGLNIEDSGEALQMGNYGLGGHYVPHLDHVEQNTSTENVFDFMGIGNRIATWMFYLSDVKLGGATIFSSAGVTIWPRKGSAAFWYNLRSSGNSDPLTRHAGCPVLIGSKWVANKWIHEYHQEFRKPCPLKPFEFMLVEKGHH